MCGYNTALDLLQTGAPAILVPFDDGGEVEQSLRAVSLAQQSAMEVLPSADMTPEKMANLVQKVIAEGRRSNDGLQMHGAETTVTLARQLMETPA